MMPRYRLTPLHESELNMDPESTTVYWYKFCAKYGHGIFKATPADVTAMLAQDGFEYTTFNEGSDTVAADEFTIICPAIAVAFDFTVGINPVEQYLNDYAGVRP